MAIKKDTEYKTVIIRHSSPEVEAVAGFIGGNNVIENGKNVIKHFRFQVSDVASEDGSDNSGIKPVSLPVTFIKELKARTQVMSIETSTTKRRELKVYNIEYVEEK